MSDDDFSLIPKAKSPNCDSCCHSDKPCFDCPNIGSHSFTCRLKETNCDADLLSSYITNGAIGVIETDTIYGLIGSALSKEVVNRIYQVKNRDTTKPFIILISDIKQLKDFGVELTEDELTKVKAYWPGAYSIILPTTENAKFEYLTRGSGKICFRMPNRNDLFELIDLAGPIVAPSANKEGDKPATTIKEAYDYFGDDVDFYSDAGTVDGKASTILELKDGEFVEVRA